MPIIPRVQPAPLPGVRMNPSAPQAAFGGGAGNALAGLDLSPVHGEAARIYQEERQKANQVALTDAGAQESDIGTDLMHGPNGALTKQGRDAFDALETTKKAYFDRTAQISAGLTDEQRAAFQETRVRNWARMNAQIQAHVAVQRTVYDTKSTDAFIAAKQNEAFTNYNDASVVDASIAAQKQKTEEYAARHGMSEDERALLVANRVSDTRAGVLSRMLDAGQDLAAAKYYAEHKGEIDGVARGKIENALAIGSSQGEALRIFNRIVAKRPDGTSPSASDALTQAESIENPLVRKNAIQLVTSHFNEIESMQRRDREGARARVLKDVEANNGRLNRASSDWQLIDGYAEGEHVLERQRQILHPPPDPGDPDKYNSYVAMAAISPATRQHLLSTNISDIVNDKTLSGGQKTAVINLIRSERSKDVADLQRDANEAERDARELERIVKKARDEKDQATVDDNIQAMYAAQQRATIARGRVISARRLAHFGSPPASEGTSAPAPAADERSRANPLGLEPPKPLTPDMLNDLAKYGEGYASYLRTMGYAVPSVLPVPRPETSKQ